MLMTRKISLTRCVAYVIVQCIGTTVGAAVLWVLTPSHRRGEAVEQCVMLAMTEVHDDDDDNDGAGGGDNGGN